MDSIKELVVDALVLLFAWFIVTASGVHQTAKGLSCGRAEAEVTEAQP